MFTGASLKPKTPMHETFILIMYSLWPVGNSETQKLGFLELELRGNLPMTRASTIDFGRKSRSQVNWSGPLRPVNVIRNKFPTYKNGSNGIVIKLADDPEMPSLKETVAKETADLLDRRQRLSVRELAMKFEKGLNTATLLSNEVCVFLIPEHSFDNWFG